MEGFPMNVEEVQRRLWEQSQQHKQHRESGSPLFPVNPYENRIRNLMDLMHHPQWIAQACKRVISRSRGKAAGVDKVTVVQFEKKLTTELETLRQELKCGTYRPQPLRRVMIPKANGKMRALGIPMLTAYCTSYNSVLEHQTDFTTILDELQTHSNNFFSLSASSLIQ